MQLHGAVFWAQVGLFSSGYTVTDRHISLRKSIVLRRDGGFEGVLESGLGSNACLSRFYTIPFDKCKIELSSNSMFFKANLPDLSSVAVRFSRYLFLYFCLSAQFPWHLTVHLEIKCRDWKHGWLRLCAPLCRPSALSPFIWVVLLRTVFYFCPHLLLRSLRVWRQPSCFSVKAACLRNLSVWQPVLCEIPLQVEVGLSVQFGCFRLSYSQNR